ncbi:phosphoglycerate mutase [Fulvitalea axinellae]|uniref:Phosphoglycerate mutase n=1 Tax=Fulvitalea axinellae TaxID=1182444 RepID=A0AAU9CJT7_9BACT|nr:phosphoglycerate mutase [Fulvitalea axinellae]
MTIAKTKTLYIVRHGQTDYNLNGYVQGRRIDADLNGTGQAQARALFDAYELERFDRCFVSTLKRTHQTVAAFAEAGVPVSPLSGFDELDYGYFEGKLIELDEEFNYPALMREWDKGKTDMSAPEGESPEDVSRRQKAALAEVLAHDGDKFMICMHSRAIRILLCGMMGRPLTEMKDFGPANTGVTQVRCHVEDGRFELLRFNDLSHLEA